MELLEHDDTLVSDSSPDTVHSLSVDAPPSHAQRLALVQRAELRLEALATPSLLAAFDTDIHSQDLPRVRCLIAVFASLRRLDLVHSMFIASRTGAWLSRMVVQCGAQQQPQRPFQNSFAHSSCGDSARAPGSSAPEYRLLIGVDASTGAQDSASARACNIVILDSLADAVSPQLHRTSSASGESECISGSSLHWPPGSISFLRTIPVKVPIIEAEATAHAAFHASVPSTLPASREMSESDVETVLAIPAWLPTLHSQLLVMIDTHARWFIQMLGLAGSAPAAAADGAMYSLSAIQLTLTQSVFVALQPLLRRWIQMYIGVHAIGAHAIANASQTGTLSRGLKSILKHTLHFASQALNLVLVHGTPSQLFTAHPPLSPHTARGSALSAADRLMYSALLPFTSLALQHQSIARLTLASTLGREVVPLVAALHSTGMDAERLRVSTSFLPSSASFERGLASAQRSIYVWSRVTLDTLSDVDWLAGGGGGAMSLTVRTLCFLLGYIIFDSLPV